MRVRAALKAATADLHDELDGRIGSLDLADAADYRRFLDIQARALPPFERALDAGGLGELVEGWGDHHRSRLLADDLAALGAAMPEPIEVPALNDRASVLGTAYVIEGSRLGGRFLARNVGAGMPTNFLAAPGQTNAWPALLHTLDNLDFSTTDLDKAIGSARECFALFLRVTNEALDR